MTEPSDTFENAAPRCTAEHRLEYVLPCLLAADHIYAGRPHLYGYQLEQQVERLRGLLADLLNDCDNWGCSPSPHYAEALRGVQ